MRALNKDRQCFYPWAGRVLFILLLNRSRAAAEARDAGQDTLEAVLEFLVAADDWHRHQLRAGLSDRGQTRRSKVVDCDLEADAAARAVGLRRQEALNALDTAFVQLVALDDQHFGRSAIAIRQILRVLQEKMTVRNRQPARQIE